MNLRKSIVLLSVALILLLFNACSSKQSQLQTGRDNDSQGFFTYPHNGELYVSHACVPITPNEQNHPEPLYLGGYGNNRMAEGVHDDLEACALLLGQDEETLVLISLDLVGIISYRARILQDRLGALGVDPERVLICSTHTHNGPDTIGFWGSSLLETGLDMTYQEYLAEAVQEVFQAAEPNMLPVTATFATGSVTMPGAAYPSLVRDSRDPQVVDDRIHAIRFDHAGRGTVVTLVNYTSHPETALDSHWITADFPRYLRERVSREYGGGAIYFSGALGGLLTPLDVPTPARDEQGNPVLVNGEPLWLTETSWDRTRSYGYVLAEAVIGLLEGKAPSSVPGIRFQKHEAYVPVTNIGLWVALQIDLLEPYEIVHEPGCGLLGCGKGEVHVITLGDAQITTSPGETFPETVLGRDEVEIDYGAPWGVMTFPALQGFVHHCTRPVAMHFALTNNFVGYIVPESDYLPPTHPEYYCEVFSASKHSERTMREGLTELLDQEDPASRSARGEP